MAYTNSKLVNYTRISPNKNSPRNHTIDRITPHCYVGQASVESMASWLCNPHAQASCNYGIGSDGRVALIAEEKDRSWCSSSPSNDHRAVTIECACAPYHPYTINDAVYNKLIELMVDICKRNGKKKILWFGDKEKTLAYDPKPDEMIITVHRWFANKECPGEYIYSRLGQIAKEVNAKLGNKTVKETTEKKETGVKWYRVRKSWTDAGSQIGAFKVLENAKANCPEGYTVYDDLGRTVYSPEISSVPKGLPKSKKDFIEKVSTIAKSLYKETNILPSVVIAQCCLETGYGLGADAVELVKRNNLLGMKSELLNSTWSSYTVWGGESFTKVTPEVVNGKTIQKEDSFRIYTDYENCIKDYEMFLLHVMSGAQYKYRRVIALTNPEDVITVISKGGYASDPKYISKVLKIIEENNLVKYDEEVGVIRDSVSLMVKEVKPAAEKWDGYYRVHAGLFTTKDDAKEYATRLQLKGLPTTVKRSGEEWLVQIGAYKVKANAEKKLQEVKAAGFDAVITP